ncbi:MAG TPA: LacI family DNA-binding transcriptional regulator [Terriglobia bacterium]|nr:LacI family DNA-binding transcriptional regulator [Terriglobia bacterium]
MNRMGISEIARLANVSIGTVDRALHSRKGISEETRKRVLDIARSIGYTPNLVARTLSVGKASIRIGVCIPRETHLFYDQLRDGILDEVRRFEPLGVEMLYHPVERLGVREAERLAGLIESDVTALIITPGDPRRITPLIDAAAKKGSKIVCVASDAPASARSTIVCVDPEVGGTLAAELLGRFVAPGSQVAVITGMLQTEDHRRKTEGFCGAFAHYCKGGQVVDVVEGHESDEETFQKCLELFEKFPRLAGLYVNISICLPVCYALRARGLARKVRVVATDLFREMVPLFEREVIHASIYQRPYVQGQTAVRLLVEHFLHARKIPPTHYLTPAIVMRSNLHLFRETRHMETGRMNGAVQVSS